MLEKLKIWAFTLNDYDESYKQKVKNCISLDELDQVVCFNVRESGWVNLEGLAEILKQE